MLLPAAATSIYCFLACVKITLDCLLNIEKCSIKNVCDSSSGCPTALRGQYLMYLPRFPRTILQGHMHKGCEYGLFDERCNFNRKTPVSSNCHCQQQRKVFTVFLSVYRLLYVDYFTLTKHSIKNACDSSSGCPTAFCGQYLMYFSIFPRTILQSHVHKGCGYGLFTERCDFNRKISVS